MGLFRALTSVVRATVRVVTLPAAVIHDMADAATGYNRGGESHTGRSLRKTIEDIEELPEDIGR